MKILALILFVLPVAAQERWVATWGTAQQQYRTAAGAGRGGRGAPAPTNPAPAAGPATPPATPAAGPARRFPVPPALAGLNNQTVRMIVRTSTAGHTLRVRLANALGAAAVNLGAAHIAIRAQGSGIVPASDRALSFGGNPSATIYAGQVLVSDPVTLDVPALTDLAVSLYFPGETGAPTSHTFGLRPAYLSKEGDFTGRAEIAEPAATMQSWYWIAGIDVLAPPAAGTLVTFGDSITDGDQSTPDTNGAWPSLLARRLQANKATAAVGVVNAGISGNRVLGDNNGGLARLLRDALTVPGVKWITVMEGINDITGATRPNAPPPLTGQPFTAATLIAAYRQMIATAHLYGVKAIGCTMTPYGGSTPYSEAGEAIRTAANEWIRTSGAFDAVFDFDAATRDAGDPHRFRAAADSPDLLHPGDAGYRLMADSVNLAVFAGKK